MPINKDSNSAVCIPSYNHDELHNIAELKRKIACRTAGRVQNLSVETYGDSILLFGRTNTYYIKQLATQVALDENPNLTLVNSIEVI